LGSLLEEIRHKSQSNDPLRDLSKQNEEINDLINEENERQDLLIKLRKANERMELELAKKEMMLAAKKAFIMENVAQSNR